MKILSNFFLLAVVLIVAACEGPAGPAGYDGEDGYNFLGTTFEFTGDFTSSNDYQLVFNFLDNDYDPYESDVILAYILWTSDDGIDYWRPLPQTAYFDSGAILQYNFDFTADIPNNRIIDMSVFLDGDVDLTTLPSEYTDNQTFRIVVAPSEFLSLADVDANDLNSILNSTNIQLKSLGTIEAGTAIDLNLQAQ